MKFDHLEISGYYDSLRASGLPHSVGEVSVDLKRGRRLASAPTGSGHDCFLKGIGVGVDITASQTWWLQFMRYHFAEIVSSQSKMHSILNFHINVQCNDYVTGNTRNELQRLKNIHLVEQSTDSFQRLIYNIPMGFELTARITTNFLQLKTIVKQRKHHKLSEWDMFIEWVRQIDKDNLIT